MRRMKPGRLLLALLAIGGVVLLSRAVLRVEAITIGGNERVTESEFLAATGLAVGEPLLWVSARDLAKALTLPWVEGIAATRSLSGELRITVRERRPAATVLTTDGRYVVAADGTPLPGAAPPALTIRGWGQDRTAESIAAAAYLEGFAEVRAIEYDPASLRLITSRGTIRTPDLAALRHAGPAALRLVARERSITSWGLAAAGLAPQGSTP